MRLEQITVRDFRNLAATTLRLAPGLNLITGANGQGKTNLLEAIGVLVSGRSLRRATPAQMRRLNGPGFALSGRVEVGAVAHRLEFTTQGARQFAKLDGKPLAAISNLTDKLAVVTFTPATLGLLRNGPAERRRFLDWMIFARDRGYPQLARGYQKGLDARNHLLRRGGTAAEFAAWEEQLATTGAAITLRRAHTAAELEQLLPGYLEGLGFDQEAVTIRLESWWRRALPGVVACTGETLPQLREGLRQLLAAARQDDRRLGYTGVGPHRDDLRLTLNGVALLEFASHGQQRRVVLALKLAEAALLRQRLGHPPLILLDDPAAELDRPGWAAMLKLLAAGGSQLFIATCNRDGVVWPDTAAAREFVLTNGEISQINDLNRSDE